MSKLESLRSKYGFKGGNYEPNPDCSSCGGTGERVRRDGKMAFCICLFVAPELSNLAADTLKATVAKLKEELKP